MAQRVRSRGPTMADRKGGERRNQGRRKVYKDIAVTDVLSGERLHLRDVSAESFSAMSPLPFPVGTSRRIQFHDLAVPELAAPAVVKRCEKWPPLGGAYVVVFAWHPSSAAHRTAILTFVQALMRVPATSGAPEIYAGAVRPRTSTKKRGRHQN